MQTWSQLLLFLDLLTVYGEALERRLFLDLLTLYGDAVEQRQTCLQ